VAHAFQGDHRACLPMMESASRALRLRCPYHFRGNSFSATAVNGCYGRLGAWPDEPGFGPLMNRVPFTVINKADTARRCSSSFSEKPFHMHHPQQTSRLLIPALTFAYYTYLRVFSLLITIPSGRPGSFWKMTGWGPQGWPPCQGPELTAGSLGSTRTPAGQKVMGSWVLLAPGWRGEGFPSALPFLSSTTLTVDHT
jgi:hypothetical protein